MKILLTGANGFLGSHLLKKLVIEHDVSITLRKKSKLERILILLETKNVKKLYIDDVTNLEIENFFKNEKIELIIHCATDYGKKTDYFCTVFESNVLFPLKLLEIGLNNGLKYFINTDSYFNKENITYNALPNYSKTKKLFLSYLKEIGKDISIINMKLEHIYGPNDNKDKFISFLFQNLIENNEIPLTHGHQKRDFVYIDDATDAYTKVVSKISNTPASYFKDLEIGSGESVCLKRFIERMALVMNSSSVLNYGALEYRDDEIMNSFANNSLREWGLEYGINFNFRNFNTGIDKMVKYEELKYLTKKTDA